MSEDSQHIREPVGKVKISEMKTADEVLAQELKDPEFAKEWERERGLKKPDEGDTR